MLDAFDTPSHVQIESQKVSKDARGYQKMPDGKVKKLLIFIDFPTFQIRVSVILGPRFRACRRSPEISASPEDLTKYEYETKARYDPWKHSFVHLTYPEVFLETKCLELILLSRKLLRLK